MHVVAMLLEEDVLVLALALMHLLPLDLGVDGVDPAGPVRVLGCLGVGAVGEEAHVGGEFGVGAGRIVLVDELEEVLPVPAKLFVHLADVLHLPDYYLLR